MINDKKEIQNLLKSWEIKKAKIVKRGDTLEVDVDGDVSLSKAFSIKKGRRFVFKWGIIKGDFDCSRCLLVSLEGAPSEVHGDFNCSANNLTILECSPKIVKGNFLCYNNRFLRSLQGCTEKVGKNFDCSNCGLPRLAYSPKEVKGDFNLAMNECQTLGGISNKIGGKIDASQNKLTSILGAPQDFNEANIDTSGNPMNPGDEMERSMWG